MQAIKNSLQQKLAERQTKDYLRTLPTMDFSNQQKGLIDFSSNDYLGLARNAELAQKIKEKCTQLTGFNGATGSRLISGNTKFVEHLEVEIAEFHHAEAALIFNSGYNANVGIFSCIATPNDTIFYDELSHASIRDGLRLSRGKTVAFKHNNLIDLAQKIAVTKGNIFVVVESVYSMDGDVAPLQKLVDLTKENDQIALMVDEAHGVGIFGGNGNGLVQALGLEKEVFARIITYGKAPGVHGASIVGPTVLKDYLINYANSFIYTTALPLHDLVGIKMSYEMLLEYDFQEKIHAKIALFLNELSNKAKSFFIESNSPIQSMVIEGNTRIKAVANTINEHGFAVKAILFPTVPKGQERIRISLHVFNTEEDIVRLAQLLNRLMAG